MHFMLVSGSYGMYGQEDCCSTRDWSSPVSDVKVAHRTRSNIFAEQDRSEKNPENTYGGNNKKKKTDNDLSSQTQTITNKQKITLERDYKYHV